MARCAPATACRDGTAFVATALLVTSMAGGVKETGTALAYAATCFALVAATRLPAWRGCTRAGVVSACRVASAAAGLYFAAGGRLLPVAVTSWPVFLVQRSLVLVVGLHAAFLRLASEGAPRLAAATAAITLAVIVAGIRPACAGILRGFLGADRFYAALDVGGSQAARTVVSALTCGFALSPPPLCAARSCAASSVAMFTADNAVGTAVDFVAARRTTPRRAVVAVAGLLVATWTLLDVAASTTASLCPPLCGAGQDAAATATPVLLSRAERLRLWPELLVAGVSRACGREH